MELYGCLYACHDRNREHYLPEVFRDAKNRVVPQDRCLQVFVCNNCFSSSFAEKSCCVI